MHIWLVTLGNACCLASSSPGHLLVQAVVFMEGHKLVVLSSALVWLIRDLTGALLRVLFLGSRLQVSLERGR